MQTLSRSAMNCSQLHSVLLNSGIASTQEILDILGYVPDGFFSRFDNLTSIKLPHNITRIGDVAFWGCRSLTSITIPNSVTSIGRGAFFNCSSLTSITIPDSVTRIGRGAFSDCSNLTSITIPNSVTNIDE